MEHKKKQYLAKLQNKYLTQNTKIKCLADLKCKYMAKIEDANRQCLDKIHQEYCLKQNKFNPAEQSPNIFCNRLEKRMKIYYGQLLNKSLQ